MDIENKIIDNLEEFSEIENIKPSKSDTIKKYIGTAIAVIGSFFTSTYISFLLLDTYPITDRAKFFYVYGNMVISPLFGIHLIGVLGFIFLLIAALIIKSTNPIVIRKLFSFIIDGTILLVCLFLAQYFFNSHENQTGSSSLFKSEMTFDFLDELFIYKTRIIIWSLFFLSYYFIGEFSYGTIGKKLAGLISYRNENAKLTYKQSFLKTFFYAVPVWGIYLIMTLKNVILIKETGTFIFCQWLSFLIIFITLISIFVSKENITLAEYFSKSKVALRG